MIDRNSESAGVGLGSVIAAILSYVKWHSIGWAIVHGVLGWVYVVYYLIVYLGG